VTTGTLEQRGQSATVLHLISGPSNGRVLANPLSWRVELRGNESDSAMADPRGFALKKMPPKPFVHVSKWDLADQAFHHGFEIARTDSG
jgi:hypothetical protein